MPFSSTSGKDWLIEHLSNINPYRILDIGPGAGTYAQLFRKRWSGSQHWTAVEIWEPYVNQYKLNEQYDVVHIADARMWVPTERYDVAFLGDVLEHMTVKDAHAVLHKIRSAADIVVVSIPIVHYPQGKVCGNPYEQHIEEDWNHEKVCELLGHTTEFTNEGEIGIYIYHQQVHEIQPLPETPQIKEQVRVAVYAIAKNEASFAKRWAESAAGADYLIVCDTGSTDGTQDILREAGVTVYQIDVNPWRFDVARNTSLALIPNDVDYCIALDLDEILVPGWRKALEEAKAQKLTRPRYSYVWSWLDDGKTPDVVYSADKIHARHGYRWNYPVHEILIASEIKEVAGNMTLEIHHHPGPSTGIKASYLPLLKLAVTENPNDDRSAHYYARELFFANRLAEAAVQFKRHLALSSAVWKPERAASMRYLAKCEPKQKTEWLLRACLEAPDTREPWVDLAKDCQIRQEWVSCYAASMAALAITERKLHYLTEANAWGSTPYDCASLAAYNLGKNDEAILYGTKAVELDPTDERLIRNLQFYTNTHNKGI